MEDIVTLADKVRGMLILLTDGPLGAAEVEWYPGDRGTYDDAPRPAYLSMVECGTHHPRISLEDPEGLTALLEVLDMTEGEFRGLKPVGGLPKCIIKREGDNLMLASVM
ncbi:MAG TPA: hypothetical protein VFT59_00800 [Candidatus Saccharimonadales bacterium]|nr:hypothetical protein [Candidatus Saccharimonadales bacterium]